MCGIFGWYITKPDTEIDGEKARYLTDLLSHRGPDSFGYFEDRNLFLGHRRLKIIDLSDDANQPLLDNSRRYCLVFNGEIYNYKELKRELESRYTFRTESDAEVLLYAYKAWGYKCLDKLLGMFAFAVFDRRSESLFLARDHLGQKPLFYACRNGHFIFSSELRSIIEHPEVEKRIDLENVMKYHIYDVFPFESTPVKGVKKLLPGHCLTLSEGVIKIHKYWESLPHCKNSLTLEDAVEQLDELLSISLRRHTRADVPMGIFLSGGIDSSIITHYARKVLGSGGIDTFSVGVDFPGLNEIDSAGSVAARYRCRSHIFSYGEGEVSSSLDEICTHMDEPLADPGMVNSYFISKKASSYIKVALSGDGGDELFGGYLAFKAAPFVNAINRFLPNFVFPFLMAAGRFLPCSDRYMSLDFRLKQFLKGIGKGSTGCLPMLLGSFTPLQMSRLYHRDILSTQNAHDYLFDDLEEISAPMKGRPLADLMLYQYQKYFLPEFVLAHTDRASMQCSLEVRAPMLDKRIVEFANRLPIYFKVKSGKLKKILFSLGEKNLLPCQVINQHKKGFTFPVSGWLKKGLNKRLRYHLLDDNAILEKVWNRGYIINLIDRHTAGKENNYRELWNLFIFAVWLKRYPYIKF